MAKTCKLCGNEFEPARRNNRLCSEACKRAAAVRRAKRWQADNPKKAAYNYQKAAANRRGIEWCFSFDEWVEWWGSDFDRRGSFAGGLVMARFGDSAPYSVENCYKCTMAENSSVTISKAKGERQHLSKLTEADVRQILSKPRVHGDGKRLAEKYGVATSTMCKILRREMWEHVA